jgi:hypothetical protein
MTDDRSMRASDAEREAVAEVLRQAHAEGRLDYDELDERLTQAYAARTLGDLDQLTRDLPAGRSRPPATRETPTPPTGAPGDSSSRLQPTQPRHPVRRPTALRGAWYVYAVAVGINVLIWAIVSLSSRELTYFWPIWVAGPWGIVLGAATLFGRRADREDRRDRPDR